MKYVALAIATLVFGMGASGSIALLSSNPNSTFDSTFNSREQLFSQCTPSEDPPKKANSDESV